MTNSSPWKMTHRNRWFMMIYLLKVVIFHGYVTNNQRVWHCFIHIKNHILVGGAITILKNMSSSMGLLFLILVENKIHVPNHQPEKYIYSMISSFSHCHGINVIFPSDLSVIFSHLSSLPTFITFIPRYCGWKKSCTTKRMVETL